MAVIARRSKRTKKFLSDFCNITVHQYDEDTLRCTRCARHAGEIEQLDVFVNGLLMLVTRDYNVRKIKGINKVIFSYDVDPYSTVHIVYHAGIKRVLTTHKPFAARKDFTYRKT